jgi:hypothetical protein
VLIVAAVGYTSEPGYPRLLHRGRFLAIDNDRQRAGRLRRAEELPFRRERCGRESAPVLHFTIGTCRRSWLDPFVYLQDILAKVLSQPAPAAR